MSGRAGKGFTVKMWWEMAEALKVGKPSPQIWAALKNPRSRQCGPFKVMRGRGTAGARRQPRYVVVNCFVQRVHQGTEASCISMADRLNLRHAKWILLRGE